jgi:hypothetical protein
MVSGSGLPGREPSPGFRVYMAEDQGIKYPGPNIAELSAGVPDTKIRSLP